MEVHDGDVISTVRRSRRTQQLCRRMCTIDRKNESESRGAPLFNDKASLLTAVYHMLKDGTFHQDLGADYLVKRDKARIAARLAKRIKDLGYDVSFTATA